MLLSGYRKNVFRAECNPSFESVHCIADLDDDVSEVLPYLNTALGGSSYIIDPPSVTFRVHGKLITVHGNRIAVNALKDEAEADRILDWLRREINEAWENRDAIEPSTQSAPRPKVMDIFRLLPADNCKQCGRPTCLVFATLAVEGVVGADDCPGISAENREKMTEYLSRFSFDV